MRRAVLIPLAAFAVWLEGCAGAAGPALSPPAPPAARAVPPPAAIPVRFTDVTAAAGIRFRQSNGATGQRYFLETTGSGACWFDFDGDARLDLFLVNCGKLPPAASPARPGRNGSRLYRNRGNGTFEDATARAGLHAAGYGQGCCAGDYDNDGDVDLYLTHYGPNQLYRNNGDGTFTDVTAAAGVGDVRWSTSAAFADMDRDGDLDLYVTNYVAYRPGQDPPCFLPGRVPAYCPPAQFDGVPDTLYRNNGDGTFTDVTAAAGVSDPAGKGLGCVWGDFDGDGDPDLYVANDGTVNRLYRNEGGGRFLDVTWEAGAGVGENGEAQAGMGVDFGDTDNDGRLDLAVANFSEEMNSLYRNEGGGLFSDRSALSGVGPPSLLRLGFGLDLFDYDLDGWNDLVVANGHVFDTMDRVRPDIGYAQAPLLHRNTGGVFEDVTAMAGPDFASPRVGRGLATADYDNDGDPDLLIVTLNGAPSLLRNDGGNANAWLGLRLLTRARPGSAARPAVGARAEVYGGGGVRTEEVRAGSGYCSQNDPRLLFGLGAVGTVERIEIRWASGATRTLRRPPVRRYLEITEGESADPFGPGK